MVILKSAPENRKTGTDLSQIYRPIHSELIQVEDILRRSTRSLTPFIAPISDNIKEQKNLIRLLKDQSRVPSSPLPAREILSVRSLIEKSGGFDYSRTLAKKYTKIAKDKLKRSFPLKKRRILESLAEIALNREN